MTPQEISAQEAEFEELAILEEFEQQYQGDELSTLDKTKSISAQDFGGEGATLHSGQVEPGIERDEPSFMESASAGLIKNVPLSSEMAAGIQTVKDLANIDSETTLKTAFNDFQENRSEFINTANDIAKESSFVTNMVGMGLSAPLYAGAGLARLFSVGAGTSFSNQETIDFQEVITEGSKTAALGGLLNVGGRWLKNGASKQAVELEMKAIKGDTKRLYKGLISHLRSTGQDTKQFVKSIGKTNIFKSSSDLDAMYTATKVARKSAGKKLGETYSKLDAKGAKPTSSDNILQRIENEIISPLEASGESGQSELAAQVRKYAQQNFTKEGPKKTVLKMGENNVLTPEITSEVAAFDMSLEAMHNFQKGLAKSIKSVLKPKSGIKASTKNASLAEEKQRILEIVSDTLENSTASAMSAADDVAVKALKTQKLDFRNILATEHILDERLLNIMPENGVKGAIGIVMDAMGSVPIKASMALGAMTNSARTGILLGTAFKTASGSQAAVATGATFSRSLAKLGEYALRNPTSKRIQRLAAWSMSGESEFENKVGVAMAEIELEENPLDRTTLDATNKIQSIIKIAQEKSPEMVPELQEMEESGDYNALGAILDSLGKVKGARQYFKPGLGFDGKVYSQEDKAMLIGQVKADKRVPSVQRLKAVKAIAETGLIPNPKDREIRQEREYKQTPPKSKKRY